MNAEGQVIGMLQKNTEADSPESYAIGISFVKGLSISALSGTDMALNSIGIKKDFRKTSHRHWFTCTSVHPSSMEKTIWNC